MLFIFWGYNQRAVIAFLRTLESNTVEQYNIVAASPQDTILKTRYRAKDVSIRKNIQLDLAEICSLIDQIYNQKTSEKILLAPTIETLNRFFLKYTFLDKK